MYIHNREAVAIAMQKPTDQKRWNSLSEFRDYLVKTGREEIVSFTGWELTTKSRRYWLFDHTIYSEPRGRGRRG